jgi:cell division septal protein FtsQ
MSTLIVIDTLNLPITNIYISGNNILNDKTIIDLADLEDYPPYISTFFSKINSKLLSNDYIKNVKIKRTLSRKIYIEIEEYKPICIYKEKLVLSSTEAIDNHYDINYVPYVINDIDDIYTKFVEKFNLIEKENMLKISHIEYVPNEVDKERFLLYMTDSNYVYITLSKIEKINKYNSIVSKLEDRKGIIYLDSGDYVEIKG